VTPATKNACVRLCGLALIFAAVASLLLLVLPAPHKPIHYLVAGTCATAALLVVICVLLWRGRSAAG